MDMRSKILVFYDPNSKLNVQHYFRELTSDYSSCIFELSDLSEYHKYEKIYLVTSNSEQIYELEKKYRKYAEKVVIVTISDKKSNLTKNRWMTKYLIYTEWIVPAKKIRYHFNQLKNILAQSIDDKYRMSYVEDYEIAELLKLGGHKFIKMLEKFKTAQNA